VFGVIAFACALAASVPAEDYLLARAARAAEKGDRAQTSELLRAWATLGPRGGLPKGLEKEAAEALAWADGAGRFRLYASRLEDRVRVGSHDPAQLVGRIDAYAVIGGETLRITRAAEEASGRLEFRIDAVDAPVIIEAIMTRFGEEVIIARSELAPIAKAELPEAQSKDAFKKTLVVEEEKTRGPEDLTPWWLFVAGGAAALLIGGAIWQETRF
jgi:hypothetical protein